MSPAWLPLYLLSIAALTLFPFSAPLCDTAVWKLDLAPLDGVANLLAFIPLGIALRRFTILRALALALAFSFTIEFAQEWLPRRQDVTDLIANTSGAWLGHSAARIWARRWPGPLLRPVTRKLLLRSTAGLLLIGLLLESIWNPGGDFSNWELFPLVIGNEATGDRPWNGQLAELTIFDRALPVGELSTVLADEPPPFWEQGGPILWLRFGDIPTGRLDGPAGPKAYFPRLPGPASVGDGAAEGLALHPSGLTLEEFVSEHLLERLRGGQHLTLEVRLRAADLESTTVSRIISFGGGLWTRNFMLGQVGADAVFRLRTPATGPNGRSPQAQTEGGVFNGEWQNVRASYDGYRSVILVDQICEREAVIALATALPMLGATLGVMLVLCTALAGLAGASFVRQGRERRVARLVASGGACAIAWGALYAVDLWTQFPGFEPWAVIIGFLAFSATVPILVGSQSQGSAGAERLADHSGQGP